MLETLVVVLEVVHHVFSPSLTKENHTVSVRQSNENSHGVQHKGEMWVRTTSGDTAFAIVSMI